MINLGSAISMKIVCVTVLIDSCCQAGISTIYFNENPTILSSFEMSIVYNLFPNVVPNRSSY